MLSETARRAIAAYGGEHLWMNATEIEAEVSARGLAFSLKRRPAFRHATIRMRVDQPYSELKPIGKNPVISGILDGCDVRLQDEKGSVITERKNARRFFPGGRRFFWWDDADMAYFANYAFWNYFTLPRLLMNSEIKWTEIKEHVLQAEFPSHIPTHSVKQEFHFDPKTGLLRQHNYTAAIISRLATAANVVHEHKTENGITFASHRIVTPMKKNGTAMKKPVLIEMHIHSFNILKKQS